MGHKQEAVSTFLSDSEGSIGDDVELRRNSFNSRIAEVRRSSVRAPSSRRSAAMGRLLEIVAPPGGTGYIDRSTFLLSVQVLSDGISEDVAEEQWQELVTSGRAKEERGGLPAAAFEAMLNDPDDLYASDAALFAGLARLESWMSEEACEAAEGGQSSPATQGPSPSSPSRERSSVASSKADRKAPRRVIAGAEVAKLGLRFQSYPPQVPVVNKVDQNSWAAKEGIRLGDEVVKMNGTDVTQISMLEFKRALSQRPVSFHITRTGNGEQDQDSALPETASKAASLSKRASVASVTGTKANIVSRADSLGSLSAYAALGGDASASRIEAASSGGGDLGEAAAAVSQAAGHRASRGAVDTDRRNEEVARLGESIGGLQEEIAMLAGGHQARFSEGAQVHVEYQGEWYSARVWRDNGDGTYCVTYDVDNTYEDVEHTRMSQVAQPEPSLPPKQLREVVQPESSTPGHQIQEELPPGAGEAKSAQINGRETELGPEEAKSLLQLGRSFFAAGDAEKARDAFDGSLHAWERLLGPDAAEVVETLEDLAKVHRALGDVHMQKCILERVLQIRERALGNEHPEVAVALGALGNACGSSGDAAGKKNFLERALSIQESLYGPDHVEIAVTLVNLGNAEGDLGNALARKNLLERALLIQEQHCGAEHGEVAVILVHLGNTHRDLGDVAKAQAMLGRALEIQESRLGADHSEVAVVLASLANAQGCAGDAAAQIKLLERALRIQESQYGPGHTQAAITRFNLALAYQLAGKVTEAREQAEKAHAALCARGSGPRHPYMELAQQLFRDLG